MTQITIEVPDALAERITAVRDRLPEILARGLDRRSFVPIEVYRHILQFLASNPSPQALLRFKPTPQIQKRISELLEKNRTGQITPTESAELEEYVCIDDLLSLLKARTLKNTTEKLKATA